MNESIAFRCQPALAQQVAAIADEEMVSVSDVARWALRDYVKRRQSKEGCKSSGEHAQLVDAQGYGQCAA